MQFTLKNVINLIFGMQPILHAILNWQFTVNSPFSPYEFFGQYENEQHF